MTVEPDRPSDSDGSAQPVRVGIVGTSWWADSMYLPALADHPNGGVVALCGRRREPAETLAAQWNVPLVFDDWKEMLDSGEIDAVIVAATNDTHHPVSMAAIERGIHVLCEKPLSTVGAEADIMARAAEQAGVVTMVPFTYRWMPVFQTVKRALDDGAVGRPHHLTFRYLAQFGRDEGYSWRFDPEVPGCGVIPDLGPHVLHIAEWLNGPIVELGAVSAVHREGGRADRPVGDRAAEDSAYLTCRFDNGSTGVLQACAMSWVGTPMGQTHELDIHGSGGRLVAVNDWDRHQQVTLLSADAQAPGRPLDLVVEPHIRLDTVHNTYRDIFRTTDAMTRQWVEAIAEGATVRPDFRDGARSQFLVETALRSAASDGVMLPTTVDAVTAPPVEAPPDRSGGDGQQ